jgi:hypothetical protein
MGACNVSRFALEYGRHHRDLRTISPDEVHASLGRPGFYVYECNIESLWARAHIREAIHIGLTNLAWMHNACRLCLASHMAARRAQVFGYRRVAVMTAGVIGWKSNGFPSSGTRATSHR